MALALLVPGRAAPCWQHSVVNSMILGKFELSGPTPFLVFGEGVPRLVKL